jgi:hypothetical protein
VIVRDKYNIHFSIAAGAAGILCALVKWHVFSWGNVPIMANGATVNDIWYYWFEGYSYALITAAVAFAASYIACTEKQSWSAFLIKYISIYTAFVFSVRGVCNMISYDVFTEIEAIIDIALLAFVYHRAEVWYSINLRKHHVNSTPRNPMEGN